MPVPPEMPRRAPHADPAHGAFGLLSAVQFAPLVEVELAPDARREVELEVGGPSVLLGTVRWIGTSDPLETTLLLDGSTVATGSSHSFAADRGGSILRARIAGGERAVLAVTNTSGTTVKVKLVLGALDANHEIGDLNT